MTHRKSIDVELPEKGFARVEAAGAIQESGLPEFFEACAPGDFGMTSLCVSVLEALAHAADIGILAAERLHGQIVADLSDGSSFDVAKLSADHRQIISTFQTVVLVDVALRHIHELCGLPTVDGELELDGLLELLQAETSESDTVRRVARLTRAYAEIRLDKADEDLAADRAVIHACAAFLHLLRDAVIKLAFETSSRPLAVALQKRDVRVAGYPYRGLQVQDQPTDRAGLLPITVDEIVGNDAYLEAGMRLARDVAGFDLEAHENPKRVNPVLFGLGRPGCGKTVTAHAVGHYFLDYCRERGVPAKFVVVRRTDWASSYQNASANNLVRLFREEVYGFEGVCGVYWPDIDTAFASRDSSQLRGEEKSNLAAVFGIFDGTLLPRDGKWFMICDANTLHMDEATVSRIAQNPCTVEGPTSVDEFVTLMRDVLLDDIARFVECDDDAWQRIGAHAAKYKLSGRNIDSICGNIRAEVQDFEFPESYFEASKEEREQIVERLGNRVSEERVFAFIDDFVDFKREAETAAEEERFEREVDSIVMRLNATQAAAERATSTRKDDR